ncbi:MAG: DUF262 domain-containing protein [Flavobacteriaceae bacterium]|nr:DUF262 domain-containing protein [Flavobacteriaceae bacterium]MCY4267274.1 DUF262 domain-containing protein [Flavobacteriaceae bacterium]
MKIKHHKIKIRELVEGYIDNQEEGVQGYGYRLDIRPPYQREFVYDDEQRNAVIDTIMEGFPLNVMYWAKVGDDRYEMIDGQQRTISIGQYKAGDFSFNGREFHNLQDDEQERFLNYELDIYICDGEPSEKLKWFERINIVGEKLEKQELRNAVYHGTWTAKAREFFSKTNCPAYRLFGKDYMNGVANRQKYLETAIQWIGQAQNPKQSIDQYMDIHAKDADANEIIAYFKEMAQWVTSIFTTYRREMKGVAWGFLYNQYGSQYYDANKMELQVSILMEDDDVQNKRGIYDYVFTKDERKLRLRAFTDTQKRKHYEKQKGRCIHPNCRFPNKTFDMKDLDADHIIPWNKGGQTTDDNLQLIHSSCNRSGKGCIHTDV